jgi:hypothetical protein
VRCRAKTENLRRTRVGPWIALSSLPPKWILAPLTFFHSSFYLHLISYRVSTSNFLRHSLSTGRRQRLSFIVSIGHLTLALRIFFECILTDILNSLSIPTSSLPRRRNKALPGQDLGQSFAQQRINPSSILAATYTHGCNIATSDTSWLSCFSRSIRVWKFHLSPLTTTRLCENTTICS